MPQSQSNLFLVVIAGGSGTRFWPKSTSKRPKQLLGFQQVSSQEKSPTLVAQTLARFDGIVPAKQRYILTTQALKNAVLEEGLSVEVLAEPQGRNTAPCVYWAARYIAEKDPQGVMLIMPSDHYIAQPDRFADVVRVAAQWASKKDDLVTLGIQPSRPETGYGYLKTGESLGQGADSKGVKRVEAFVEKPNLERAQEFVKAGNYLWNGGMFLWRAEVILKAFDQFMPEMKKAWEESKGQVELAYPKLTATSIDYGVMEKAKNVVTFPLDCGWDDLGSWTSLENLADVLNARRGTNVITGGDLLAIESNGNIVDAPHRLVALLGVNDLIVVEQGDAILVATKDRAQDIKRVVEEVKKKRPDLV
jgi:mannose-1-phosphate guanylyltransferase